MEKVENAIRGRDNCRLNDLRMMTHFQHTGKNEELNSLHNKVFIEMMTNMYGRGGGVVIAVAGRYLPKASVADQEQKYPTGNVLLCTSTYGTY